MLALLNNLLRHVLLNGVDALGPLPKSAEQVRFQPPDEQWRLAVSNLQRNALNVYLVDVRENRKLRSNERVRSFENGDFIEEPVPARLDCHYLITAWSPIDEALPLEPTLDEHTLLYQVAEVLFRIGSFNPSRVYPAGSAALRNWPERWQTEYLPATIAPVEGFSKLSEFWSNMGPNARWKPALYLIVTVPIEFMRAVSGPMVTTRITEYRQIGQTGPPEIWIQIGGNVLNARDPFPDGSPKPVPDTWVQLQTLTGSSLGTTATNELGRFTFGDMQAGSYRLHVRASGLGEKTEDITVPSSSGSYDVRFT